MPELLPTEWIVAHRCVDLSARFGSDTLDALVVAAKSDENALAAMEARFGAGFGVETDLRSDPRVNGGGILISHDPVVSGRAYVTLAEALDLYRANRRARLPGAQHQGLRPAGAAQALARPSRRRSLFHLRRRRSGCARDGLCGITAYGRESEIEVFNPAQARHPLPNYQSIAGVWLDNFFPDFWIDADVIARHFVRGKDVALVSPELHAWGRQDRGDADAILDALSRKPGDVAAEISAAAPAALHQFPSLAQSFFNA